MLKRNPYAKGMLAIALLMVVTAARAEPGDDAAVAQARKDYEEAMKGHDVGVQNAMKIELQVQQHLAKARAAKKNAANNQSALATKATG